MTDHKVKVIATSNFGDESVAEYEVARFMREREANAYCKWLNACNDDSCPIWYRVVDVEKRLWRGMEDLV